MPQPNVESPLETTETKARPRVLPCDEPCPKCGTQDINRKLRSGRGSILFDPEERLIIKGETHPVYAIRGQYIRHQCRCCGFVWGSDCLDAKATPDKPACPPATSSRKIRK